MILFQLGQTIKDENGSGSVVVITSGQESQMSYKEKVAFEVFLPLDQKQVHTYYLTNASREYNCILPCFLKNVRLEPQVFFP